MSLVNVAAGLLGIGLAAKRAGEVVGVLAEQTAKASESARKDLRALAEEVKVTAGLVDKVNEATMGAGGAAGKFASGLADEVVDELEQRGFVK